MQPSVAVAAGRNRASSEIMNTVSTAAKREINTQTPVARNVAAARPQLRRTSARTTAVRQNTRNRPKPMTLARPRMLAAGQSVGLPATTNPTPHQRPVQSSRQSGESHQEEKRRMDRRFIGAVGNRWLGFGRSCFGFVCGRLGWNAAVFIRAERLFTKAIQAEVEFRSLLFVSGNEHTGRNGSLFYCPV